jgi:hypothetical protein
MCKFATCRRLFANFTAACAALAGRLRLLFGDDIASTLWQIQPSFFCCVPGFAMKPKICAVIIAMLLALPAAARAQAGHGGGDEEEIAEITVKASRVANTRPAGSYASIATVLRFDPLTELQSRGLPEGQADVTVRGGLFENTGFRVAAVTIMDPQTGHYVAELPIDPSVLAPPDLLTGIDNALAGFNSNIATVRYAVPAMREGGAVRIGVGSDDLRFLSLRAAARGARGAEAETGVAFSAALSEGDGTVSNGDHAFQRYNLHLQRDARGSQSDLIVAYQDKFYGWPGAYTGFASLAETDDTQTTLVLANHRRATARGWWQAAGFYRRLEDDYDFDRTTRESGAPGSFDHETRIYGIGFEARMRRGALDWNLAGQLTADELVRSTDLTNGDFTTRSYGRLSIVPAFEIERPGGRSVMLRFGASADVSNRDSDAVSPVLGLTLQTVRTSMTRSVTLEYAGTTQLPGYTALASGPSGLFGGNPALGREKARQLLLSFERQAFRWRGSVSLFYRDDLDLVDWTYASDSPFARQANPVDIEVYGVEALYGRSFRALDLGLGYTWLNKDADYGPALVDASFYALNFARHRATLAVTYRLNDRLEFRLDNEYREQERNPLRASSDQAFIAAATLAWESGRGFGLGLTADNLTDDDYQQFPGTPAIGRQVSVRASYLW